MVTVTDRQVYLFQPYDEKSERPFKYHLCVLFFALFVKRFFVSFLETHSSNLFLETPISKLNCQWTKWHKICPVVYLICVIVKDTLLLLCRLPLSSLLPCSVPVS